jgi:hypothetical protein
MKRLIVLGVLVFGISGLGWANGNGQGQNGNGQGQNGNGQGQNGNASVQMPEGPAFELPAVPPSRSGLVGSLAALFEESERYWFWGSVAVRFRSQNCRQGR